MENLITSFETSKRLSQILENQKTEFGWFGNENHISADGERWVWSSTINPINNQQGDHREDIGCENPICKAFAVAEMMPFFADGRNGEFLNNAIQKKLNSGNQLYSFIADPEFYANLIFEITLLSKIELMESGFGGIDRNGNVVDRRVNNDAVPFAENRLFNTPKPL